LFESIEIYKTNKIIKNIEKWFKNVGVVVLGDFRAFLRSRRSYGQTVRREDRHG